MSQIATLSWKSQFVISNLENQNLDRIMAKTTKALMIPDELVVTKIYLIRGQKVMLDNDLADLYDIETK